MTKAEIENKKVYRGRPERAYSDEGGPWVYGKLIIEDACVGIIPKAVDGTYDIMWDLGGIDLIGTVHYILPETLSEWTGYTDCNDIKIFEGDILEIANRSNSELRSKRIVPEIRSIGWNFDSWDEWLTSKHLYSFTVVGNIYESQTGDEHENRNSRC